MAQKLARKSSTCIGLEFTKIIVMNIFQLEKIIDLLAHVIVIIEASIQRGTLQIFAAFSQFFRVFF